MTSPNEPKPESPKSDAAPSGGSQVIHQQDMIGRFAQHKVAANLLMIIMLLAGIIGLSKLNTQFLPTFALDYVTVRVVWPGATAEDIARSVTTPLEQELKNLDFVKEMRSVSSRGFGTIIIEYEEGSDMGLALDQVKEFVSLVRNLPSDAEEPKVTKVVRNEDVATLILTSDNSLEELRPLAYQFERELLAKGIAKVDFTGLPEQEIAIQIPAQTIERLKLSLPQIGRLITDQSQDIPAGTSGKNEVARELRSLEQRRTDKGFRELAILTSKNAQRLTLDDIADIDQRAKDNQVEVFYKGNPAILMRILRTENSDTLEAAEILQTKHGISAEVVDLRSIRPLDQDAIINSVKKTNRAVIVDESKPFCGVSAMMVTLIQEHAFDYLDAPIQRVNTMDAPAIYSPAIEDEQLPTAAKIVEKVLKITPVKAEKHRSYRIYKTY